MKEQTRRMAPVRSSLPSNVGRRVRFIKSALASSISAAAAAPPPPDLLPPLPE